MPDIPEEAWTAVDTALESLPQPDSQFERDRWRIVSRMAVEAAAPVVAEEAARRIGARMEARGPQEGFAGSLASSLRRAWPRHFSIAARIEGR